MAKAEFADLIGDRDLKIMSGVIERSSQFPDSNTVKGRRFVRRNSDGTDEYEDYSQTTHFIETVVRLKDSSGKIEAFYGPKFLGMAGGDELVVVWRPTKSQILRVTNLTMKRTRDYEDFSKDAKGNGSQIGSAIWSAFKALMVVIVLMAMSSELNSGFLDLVVGIGGNILIAYAFYVGWKKWPEKGETINEDRVIVDKIYSDMGWIDFDGPEITPPPLPQKTEG